jgi:EAL domain-containing protein (putative c-di-GMP-specific phosphodiesterase class I)
MKQLVEEELREAIAGGQLEIHYQPQVSADGMRILGAEALVRWRHPTRGMIPPGEFIHVAEECGLVIALNDWVLRRACLDAKRWGDLSISVNVSAAQFKLSNFVDNLMTTVREAGFDPARLELELTEGMIVEDEEKAEEAIFDLRGHGISLALDDFGTGYSSLSYLRRFPFDTLKIDRSFVAEMLESDDARAIVRMTTRLAEELGIRTVAEGVESEAQLLAVAQSGCDVMQGFVVARPMPLGDLTPFLQRWRAVPPQAVTTR